MKKDKNKGKVNTTAPNAASGKKGKIKQTAKNAVNKTKSAAKNAVNKTKAYTGKIKKAYNEGFAAGYEAAQLIPNVVGARTAASVGFNNGAKAKHKSEKSKTKVNRIRAKAKG